MTEQKSEAWRALRAGKVTCSILSDVMAVRSRGTGELAGRRGVRVRAILERLSSEPLPEFGNASTRWGQDHEPLARQLYEAVTGNLLEEDGFIEHPQIRGFGGSPDGIVRRDDGTIEGGAEIKCPHAGINHIECLLSGEVPAEHIDQIQGNMAVTGADWWDFISFDPRMPKHLRLFVRRVWRDQAYIDTRIIPAVAELLAEIADGVDALLHLDQVFVLYDDTLDRAAVEARKAAALKEAERIAAEEAAKKEAAKKEAAAAKKTKA